MRILPPRADKPGGSSERPGYWPTWALLSLFVFIAFECILLAFAMKGSWLILLVPGAVCGIVAWETWGVLKRSAE
jgi:hypothetical protein